MLCKISRKPVNIVLFKRVKFEKRATQKRWYILAGRGGDGLDGIWYWLTLSPEIYRKKHRSLVLTIFNEGAYLTFKSIFHKALNLF